MVGAYRGQGLCSSFLLLSFIVHELDFHVLPFLQCLEASVLGSALYTSESMHLPSWACEERGIIVLGLTESQAPILVPTLPNKQRILCTRGWKPRNDR